jgi:hypothetical protein
MYKEGVPSKSRQTHYPEDRNEDTPKRYSM